MLVPSMVNIAANLAAKARSEGIVVFTVGLGPKMKIVRYGPQTDEHLKCVPIPTTPRPAAAPQQQASRSACTAMQSR